MRTHDIGATLVSCARAPQGLGGGGGGFDATRCDKRSVLGSGVGKGFQGCMRWREGRRVMVVVVVEF